MSSQLFPKRSDLADLLSRFSQAKIAVVGDFFLDRYLVIDPALAEPSVETGLFAHQVVAIRNSPGAAGTVVNNLVALGATTLFAVGIIGEDAYGYELTRELARRGVDTSGLCATPKRFTPTYTKPMLAEVTGEREIERIDIVNRTPTPQSLEEELLRRFEGILQQVDAVILLDQVNQPEHGVLTRNVRETICSLAPQYPRVVFYADSRKQIDLFHDVIIKINHREALRATGRADREEAQPEELGACGVELMKRTHRPVVITMGPKGMLLTEETGQTIVPGIPVTGPIDIVGAGDSATAGMVLSLCAGASLPQAALVGNLVASLTIQQLGTTGTASPDQVLARFNETVSKGATV